jgi:hypothetical protein
MVDGHKDGITYLEQIKRLKDNEMIHEHIDYLLNDEPQIGLHVGRVPRVASKTERVVNWVQIGEYGARNGKAACFRKYHTVRHLILIPQNYFYRLLDFRS